MKRWGIFTLILSLTLLSGCQKTTMQVNQLPAYRLDLAQSTSELQAVSDLVIIFEPQEQENVTTLYADGNVSYGYTKTIGNVLEVCFGDILPGDSICVTEECYTTDDGSILWTQGGYLPMRTGESYLLFLKAYDTDSVYEGMYFPVDLEYGKYVLPPEVSALSSEEQPLNAEYFQVTEAADLDTYSQWYEEVFALYPDLSR